MRARTWRRAGAARLMVVGCAVALAALCVPASPLNVVGAQAGADANEAPGAPTNFRRLTAGAQHTCAVLASGAVRCWGLGSDGRLGYGNTRTIGDDELPESVAPVDLGVGRIATEIAASGASPGAHTCAILDNGSVRCWGDGGSGQLGYGNTGDVGDNESPGSVAPVNLGPGRTAVAIAAGGFHTCAILDNHTVRCWGQNNEGQLGYGNTNNVGDNESPGSVGPVNLGAGRTAIAITAGTSHTCAILDNHTVRCWGNGTFGRLGYGNTRNVGRTDTPASVGPVNLGEGRTALAITAGDAHTCAILDNRAVRCWGRQSGGALGYGNRLDVGDNEVPGSVGPVNLGAGRTATAITAGEFHTCASLDNFTVRCWGLGASGRLGYGNQTAIGDNETPGSVGPVIIGSGRLVLAITAGREHTCVRVLANGPGIVCWGEGQSGRLGYGNNRTIGDNETPASVGFVPVGNQPAVSVAVSADQAAVNLGATIDYHVTVANIGAVALTGVTMTDPAAVGCEQPVPDLAIGEEHTIDCTYTTTPADVGTYVNTATVDTDQTDPVASAPVEVAVSDDPAPGVAVQVTADQQEVESGGDIGFHVAVANTGNVDLTGVTVADPVAPACEQPVPDLGVGERFVIDCVRTTSADDIGTLTNVATVGSDQTGPVDSAGIDVRVTPALQPDLAVRKAGGVAIGDGVYNADGVGQTRTSRRAPGETAVFYVPITNDGQGADTVDLRSVGAHPGVRVRWFAERFGREITAAMDAGTYRTVELAPGQTTIIRVEVTVDATAAPGTIPTVTVRARSHTTPSRLDTVKAAVQVR